MTFEEVFSIEHLFTCARECLKGVSWKQSTQMFEINLLQWVAQLHSQLMDGAYRSRGFTHFVLHERGKRREISSVHISERCVQKCLCNYALKPVIVPKLIYDNAATINERGTDFALKRLREHLRWHIARYGRSGGILTTDFHNYFGSIRHDLLINMYEPLFSDRRILELLSYFINCFDGDVGLGLGSEISQISAVFYPNSVDHHMKDIERTHAYARYMDDGYMIDTSLDSLKRKRDVYAEMSARLGLELNEKMTQITRLDCGSFVYLKKRVFISDSNKIVMRLLPRNITQRRRNIKKQANLIKAGRMDITARNQSFASWEGYADKYNSHTSVEHLKTMLDIPIFDSAGRCEP